MEEAEVVEDDLEVEAAAGVGVFMDEVLLKIELNLFLIFFRVDISLLLNVSFLPPSEKQSTMKKSSS